MEEQGLTGLYIACQRGHFKIVQLLIEDPRIEIEQATDESVTPLETACVKSNNEIARSSKRLVSSFLDFSSKSQLTLSTSFFEKEWSA